MKKTVNKNKKKLIIVIVLILSIISILYSLISLTSAYYTSIGRFLDQQKNPYVDGEGQKRLAEDFIVNGCGEGTIIDTVTGLCWNKNLNVGTGTKQWALNTAYSEPIWTGSSYNWDSQVATDYPAFKVCDDLTTGGNTDWRMPILSELLTLIDRMGGYGTTCTSLSGFGFTNCKNSGYWSSNHIGISTNGAFSVNLGSGYSNGYIKDSSLYVACVRRN